MDGDERVVSRPSIRSAVARAVSVDARRALGHAMGGEDDMIVGGGASHLARVRVRGKESRPRVLLG